MLHVSNKSQRDAEVYFLSDSFHAKEKKKKRKTKKTHLDHPEPVGAQLQDPQLPERLQPFDPRDLVRRDVQLLQRVRRARVCRVSRERAQGLDLVVRQLEAAQRREGREVWNCR